MLAARVRRHRIGDERAPSCDRNSGAAWAPPRVNGVFDYQIGGDYPPPPGVRILARDGFNGSAHVGAYSICYVNAFQTQSDEDGVDRPDEQSNWPAGLVLEELGDDPTGVASTWSTSAAGPSGRRRRTGCSPMIQTCADKGFHAIDYDNLDSWTRMDGTPVEDDVPFGKAQANAYAGRLTDRAHALGLAVAQKNGLDLNRRQSRERIGFDFAIAEECGRFSECRDYRALFGNRVIVIEYRRRDFGRACKAVGKMMSVVLRDVNVTRPGQASYQYAAC